MGELIVKKSDASQKKVSKQQAEAVGVGAFNSMLSNAAARWSIRITLIRAGVWVGGLSFLLLLAFFLLRSLIPYFLNELTDQAPKLRETAPEWYCATAYRISDKVTSELCEGIKGN